MRDSNDTKLIDNSGIFNIGSSGSNWNIRLPVSRFIWY